MSDQTKTTEPAGAEVPALQGSEQGERAYRRDRTEFKLNNAPAVSPTETTEIPSPVCGVGLVPTLSDCSCIVRHVMVSSGRDA